LRGTRGQKEIDALASFPWSSRVVVLRGRGRACRGVRRGRDGWLKGLAIIAIVLAIIVGCCGKCDSSIVAGAV